MRRVYKPLSWEKDLKRMKDISKVHITPHMYIRGYISEIIQFMEHYDFTDGDRLQLMELIDYLDEMEKNS